MSAFFYIYMVIWIGFCLAALILFCKEPRVYAFTGKDYWRFLFKPWKLATFFLAAAGMIVLVPYTIDPTWDYVDASFMSVLTFASAPWAVGALYKSCRKKLPARQAWVAFCVWMFSASWSYDLYLLWRDGYYPPTWLANIFASSLLYVSAGLMWNLDYQKDRGVVFAFRQDNWPAPSPQPVFRKILWFALPFIVLVAAMLLYLVPLPWRR